MSPLVVSQLLPPTGRYFDVVIFDEASQVRPAEAIAAILRGSQLVVAGDEHQLPPTDFFDRPATTDRRRRRRPTLAADSQGFESILDVLDAAVVAGRGRSLALPQPRRAADRVLQRAHLRRRR